MEIPVSIQLTCPKCNLRSWAPASVSIALCACGTVLKEASTTQEK